MIVVKPGLRGTGMTLLRLYLAYVASKQDALLSTKIWIEVVSNGRNS